MVKPEFVIIHLSTDLLRLLEGTHSIDGKRITVKRKKKVPQDPVGIYIQGLSEHTTQDCLSYYLEKFCNNASVRNVYFGSNRNALALFDTEPGKDAVIWPFFVLVKNMSVFITVH